jgi:hypothetical protein
MPSAYAPPAAMPSAYVPPAAMPVAVMPQAQSSRGGMMGVIVVLLALAGGGYYYYTHYIKPTPPASQPQPSPNPGPNPPNPGPNPGGGSNAALVKAQDFEAQWQNVSGMIQLNNETWKNNGTVTVQSATLECDQLDANGNTLDEMRTTLNGPVAAGDTDGFSPFTMGATAANTAEIPIRAAWECGIASRRRYDCARAPLAALRATASRMGTRRKWLWIESDELKRGR